MLLAKLTLSPRRSRWLRRRVLCDSSSTSDWARTSQSSRYLKMQIPICLRRERATPMHFVKVWGARDSPRKDRVLTSHFLSDGGLSGCERMVFQVQRKNQSPVRICEMICFSMILFMRARFRCLRSRMGWGPSSFLGTRK